jgi:Kae1-associated kinase Bud32
MKTLISQGAEAKIFLSVVQTEPTIYKERVVKGYRHPQLDKQIRTRRTRSEAKILIKALKVEVNVPKVKSIDKETQTILLEFIEGDRLSETLNSYPEKKQFEVMEKVGEQVAKLHENNIIHGDLTTSNVILKENQTYIIDFGLGFISTKLEDKAVDLHLIKQALEAKHYQNWEDLFNAFTKGYSWEDSDKAVERLEIVEKRGRYKH